MSVPPAILASLEAVAKLFDQAPTIMAQTYAEPGAENDGVPLVRNHFTRAGQAQYHFPALSPAYAAEKAGQTKRLKKGMKAAGRVVPRGDLPILVRTGKLRDAVSAPGHRIVQTGDTATVTFRNLPDYAKYLHEGTAKMPARSPVNPGPEDLAKIRAVFAKRLAAARGQASGRPLMGPGSVQLGS